MRKINNYLKSLKLSNDELSALDNATSEIQNQLDLKADSPTGLIQVFSGNAVIYETDDLTTVYDNSDGADYILVHPGSYNIGNNSIQFRDGVGWRFSPNVSISSDSLNGTFYDNGVNVALDFFGNPTIINTNGFTKRIVMTSSVYDIRGFIDEGIYLVKEFYRDANAGNSTINYVYVLKSNLPNFTSYGDTNEDVYGLLFDEFIYESIDLMSTEISIMQDGEELGVSDFIAYPSNGDYVADKTFIDFLLGVTGLLEKFILKIKVFYKKDYHSLF